MKILVTGGTGYVGASLVKKLVEEGTEVRCLVRSKEKFKTLVDNNNVELQEGDLNHMPSLRNAVQGCEQIYHLAAYANIWSKDPNQYHQINVSGTRNLLEAARREGVRKVVVTSTAGVMGPCDIDALPVNENSNPQPVFYSQYDQSKFDQERIALDFVHQDIEVVIVNPSRIYGPGIRGVSNSVSTLIELFDQGKWRFIPGDGRSMGNYVYIDDVVNGHLLAMQYGKTGNRYILGGENISYSDFFKKLNHLTQRHQNLFKVPVTLLLWWSYGEIFLAKTLNKKPMIVPAFVQKLSKNWNLSSDKAMKEINYSFADLNTGIRKTLQWLRNE